MTDNQILEDLKDWLENRVFDLIDTEGITQDQVNLALLRLGESLVHQFKEI